MLSPTLFASTVLCLTGWLLQAQGTPGGVSTPPKTYVDSGGYEFPVPKLGPFFDPWRAGAEEVDPIAMCELAFELERAHYATTEQYPRYLRSKALPKLEILAKEGHPKGMHYYAECLTTFRQWEKRPETWATKAYEAGELEAMLLIGRIEYNAPYGDKAKSEAIDKEFDKEYAARVRAGDVEMIKKAWLYGGALTRVEGGTRYEWGTTLRQGALLGDRECQFEYGKALRGFPDEAQKDGLLPEDMVISGLSARDLLRMGDEWIRKAADQHHWEAAIHLAERASPLYATETFGMTSDDWWEYAETLLGGRNLQLNMIYEGHPDDDVEEGEEGQTEESESDPEPPAPVKAAPKKAAPKPQPKPKPVSSAPKKQTSPKPTK